MNLLIKLEDLINKLITWLQGQVIKIVVRLAPQPVKNLWTKTCAFFTFLVSIVKNLPALTIKAVKDLIAYAKKTLAAFDYKAKLIGTYQVALEKYKQNKPQKNLGKFKKAFLAPFLIIGQWLNGLSTVQSLVLLTFTGLSFLAMIGMVFSGQRLASQHFMNSRAPASVDEEVTYERPVYYKKQSRFLDVTSIRLPVYVAQVNEIRSVDIDFSATLSNRHSRMVLEKLEFQLRDHLILNMEPVTASFPLEEEGKEIIRLKILSEVNDFLIQKKIEGRVQDLKITYILAN